MAASDTSSRKTKDPIRYPKVQGGYESLCKVAFEVQLKSLFKDLTKKMVEIKKR